jgi:hypothetical protein
MSDISQDLHFEPKISLSQLSPAIGLMLHKLYLT